MERIFDICPRLPPLRQLVQRVSDAVRPRRREQDDGGRRRRQGDYWKVVDQCYLCDVCYMTKCPYVPPHPWNVDFPHLMLRGKAVKFKTRATSFRDRLPRPARIARQARDDPGGRRDGQQREHTPSRAGDGQHARHRERAGAAAVCPRRFPTRQPASIAWPARDGERTPGKVAIFATCYVNYNEPGIGHDLVRILRTTSAVRAGREGGVLRHAEARAGRPRVGRELKERQHSGARAARARRLRDPRRRCRRAR
jgi:Fe-S oxidoreductase